jgi:hypothetical protein
MGRGFGPSHYVIKLTFLGSPRNTWLQQLSHGYGTEDHCPAPHRGKLLTIVNGMAQLQKDIVSPVRIH